METTKLNLTGTEKQIKYANDLWKNWEKSVLRAISKGKMGNDRYDWAGLYNAIISMNEIKAGTLINVLNNELSINMRKKQLGESFESQLSL